ncbi:MAG: dynamin family protein, partial [Snowella sp.]|nr:dynamin family protein [Snowella sp.]
MSRSAKIAEIIDKRKPLAQRIETAIGNLEALRGALKSIEMKRKELLPKLKDETAKDKLEGIDFISAHDAITSQLVHLEKLEARFARKTLNVGVIGMMRQGKSTLLQSLTGLDNNVIPAKSGGVCTAVRSKIRHQPHGETQAIVSFHSESSFVNEVLKPYYNDLSLTPVPHTLADFIYSELPSLKPENTSQQQAIYNRFVDDYYKNRHSLQKYLKPTEVKEAIAIDKIQEYVTHLHGKPGDEQYKYLAVKEVEISCTFPNDDVGKITVVDIPGLGDFKSSDRQLMLETLGKEVDVILLIRRPDVIGDDLQDKDTELYDKAEIAVNDLSKRIFIVLNRLSGNDAALDACKDFEAKLRGGSLGIGFVDCLIADCSDANEAQNKVLDIVLNYLTQKITELDFELAKLCQDNLQSIHKAVQKALEDSRKALGDIDDDDYQDIEEIYSELFGDKDSGWWREITLRLQELRSEIWFQRQAPNDDLYEAFMEALNLCTADKGILSKENAIELINDQIKIVGAFRAYPDYQDELRVLISHRFLALDTSLQQTVEKMKTRVAKILKDVGKVEALSALDGTPFFDEIYDLVPDRYRMLKEGFRIIAEFRLSYRGLILPRIRQHLDGLTSITAMAGHHGFSETQEDQTLAVSANTTADEIFMALEIDYDKAIYRLKPALEELLCEPNEAVFAMVEEFIDNVIRQQGISNEWKNFLRRYKG